MGKAAEQYEVRRDVDVGSRILKRGSKISLSELERLAPGKAGPLRRTGLIRPVGGSDRDEIRWRRDAQRSRRAQANAFEAEHMRTGGSDEQV